MRINILWAMVAILALTACDNENEDAWNGEIRLDSRVNTPSVTKAFGLDKKIKEGQGVSLWVDDAKDPLTTVAKENLYENNILTVQSDGTLGGGTAMFFPDTDNKVDIYAIHPAVDGSVVAFPATVFHAVKDNQVSDTGYAASDLLYAVKKGVARTSAVIPMSFNHILSKVEVTLVAGEGTPSFEGATVTLEGLRLKAVFTPAKDADLSKSTIGLSADNNDAAPITIGNATGGNVNEAIVAPQTWTADATSQKTFIKITLKGGGVLTYVPTANIAFESGKKYAYTVTANLTGLSVSSSIADWGNGTTVGDAAAEMR